MELVKKSLLAVIFVILMLQATQCKEVIELLIEGYNTKCVIESFSVNEVLSVSVALDKESNQEDLAAQLFIRTVDGLVLKSSSAKDLDIIKMSYRFVRSDEVFICVKNDAETEKGYQVTIAGSRFFDYRATAPQKEDFNVVESKLLEVRSILGKVTTLAKVADERLRRLSGMGNRWESLMNWSSFLGIAVIVCLTLLQIWILQREGSSRKVR